MARFAAIPLSLILIALISSCASMKTQQDQYIDSVPLARSGSYREAALLIEQAKGEMYKEKDLVLYYLDLGMLQHWSGEYELSNESLSKAEVAIEELFTKSVSKALTSGLLNDNALDYSGEDYEDIYLNVFKALNYIALDDQEAALVEIRRVQIKLNILEDKYKVIAEEYNASEGAEGELKYRESQFHSSVLAYYISLLLYRSEESWDDARIDHEMIEEAWKTQKQLYDFPKPPLPVNIPIDDDQALVNVISFTGMSPLKVADTIYLQTGPNIVYLAMTGQDDDYVTNLVGFTFLVIPGIQSGIHFKIQFPRLVSRRSEVDRVLVKMNGVEVADIPLLEKMENIARESFLLSQPLTIGKTIIRATIKNVTKEIGKHAMNEELGKQGAGGAIFGLLAGLAADVAVDATENADLRISQFFPSHARATEITVVPGTYHVTLEYWNGNKLITEIDQGMQEFFAGGLNLIEGYLLQ